MLKGVFGQDLVCHCGTPLLSYANDIKVEYIFYCPKCDKMYDSERLECHHKYDDIEHDNLACYQNKSRQKYFRKTFKKMLKEHKEKVMEQPLSFIDEQIQ